LAAITAVTTSIARLALESKRIMTEIGKGDGMAMGLRAAR